LRTGAGEVRDGATATRAGTASASASAATEKDLGLDATPAASFDRAPARNTAHLEAAAPCEQALPPATLNFLGRRKLDVDSASGIVALGEGRFLVVDDDKGVYISDLVGHAHREVSSKKYRQLKDLEGICLTPDGEHALVICEGTGEVFKLRIKNDDGEYSLGKPKRVGELPKLRRTTNKGWEGIDMIPGRFFNDGEPRLVAVNEGKPRRVGLFGYPDLGSGVHFKLPKAAKPYLEDLSDVAVDPKTGHIFLLSDESTNIVELRLKQQTIATPGAIVDGSALEFVGVTAVSASNREKPEGLDFGPDGRLWLAMDGKSTLLEYEVTR